MRVDQATVALRPRDAWEAIDLGWLLVRRLGRALWLPWLATAVPLWVLALGVGVSVDPLLGALLLWWLQPQGERVLLAILAEALFGAPPAVAASVRRLPTLVAGGIVSGLFLGRFDPTRAYIAPVAQLEGLRGAARSKREALLRRRDRGVAFLYAALALLLQLVLLASALAFLAALLPAPLAPDWELHLLALGDGQLASSMRWLIAGLLALVLLVSRPFQVAGGFALYINRRTSLEGWDIEQAFRLLSERVERPRPERPDRAESSGVAALAFGLLSVFSGASLNSHAAAPGPSGPHLRAAVQVRLKDAFTLDSQAGSAPDPVQTLLDEVLESPDFGRTTRRPSWTWSTESDSPEAKELPFAGILATVFQIALWVALAGLFGAAIAWLLGVRPRPRRPADEERIRPTQLVGLDLRPDSLPADVAAAAEALWDQNRQREALALLFRASLQRLSDRHGLELEAGDTEADCLRGVRALRDREAVNAATAAYFSELTAAWQRSAYAQLEVEPQLGTRLCRAWRARIETEQAA